MGEFLAAFGQLAPAQREALVLSVVDGQSYDAIARAAGVSVGTVKSRVSRGRRALERLLMGEPPTDEPGFDAAGDRRHPNPARRRQGAGGYGAAEKVFDAEPS
jgi:RNA polymerase sigma-70 factor (ECF subfamily)